MDFTWHDDTVSALAADRSDQPFGDAVLPRKPGRDWLVTDAHWFVVGASRRRRRPDVGSGSGNVEHHSREMPL
jgi:hypothetical protein